MPAPELAALYLDHVSRLQRAYERIFTKHSLDAILLSSGTQRPRSTFDDQLWPLRVMPHFAHFLPLAEADCVLELRPGEKPRLHRYTDGSFWEKPSAPPAHALSACDVVVARSFDELSRALPPASSRVVYIGEDAARAAQLGHTLCASAAILRDIDETRVHKSPYELACLTEANRIGALGHAALRDAFMHGGAESELDLHLMYLRATEQDDADAPYKNIVALGEHAATLHHVSYGRARGTGATSLLVDAGVSYRGYASDVTRTYARGASAELDAFRALVAGVDALQRRLCAEIALGRLYQSLHDQAHVYLGEAMRDVGLLRGSVDEVVSRGVTRAFLPHGLGHSLGITCHDVGCAELKPRAENPFLRNTRAIEVDQVFTIEPGVYFIGPLLAPLRADDRAALVDWKLCDALAPLGGIRIEDDLHVTPTGAANLTRAHLPQ